MAEKITALRSPYYSNLVGNATIVVAAEAADAVAVTIQLKDTNFADLRQRGAVHFYLSDDANGDSVIATAHSGGVAVGTDGLMVEFVADKAGLLVSESDGDIDLVFTEAGTKVAYLILVMPDGRLVASGAITHAA